MPANAWVSALRYLCYMIVTIRGGNPKRSENNKGGGLSPDVCRSAPSFPAYLLGRRLLYLPQKE